MSEFVRIHRIKHIRVKSATSDKSTPIYLAVKQKAEGEPDKQTKADKPETSECTNHDKAIELMKNTQTSYQKDVQAALTRLTKVIDDNNKLFNELIKYIEESK